MERLRKLLGGILGSLAPVILFYGAEHLLSLRWAIGLTTAYTVGEVVWRKARGQKLDQLFIFIATMTIGFGAIDLFINQPLFLKYEAVMTNLLTGGYVGLTAWKGRSLLELAYEKQPDAKPLTPELAAYFRFLTAVWTVYFFAKAGLYLYLAPRYDYDHLMAIRTVVGNVSMLVLLGLCFALGWRAFDLARRLGLVKVAEPAPEPASTSP